MATAVVSQNLSRARQLRHHAVPDASVKRQRMNQHDAPRRCDECGMKCIRDIALVGSLKHCSFEVEWHGSPSRAVLSQDLRQAVRPSPEERSTHHNRRANLYLRRRLASMYWRWKLPGSVKYAVYGGPHNDGKRLRYLLHSLLPGSAPRSQRLRSRSPRPAPYKVSLDGTHRPAAPHARRSTGGAARVPESPIYGSRDKPPRRRGRRHEILHRPPAIPSRRLWRTRTRESSTPPVPERWSRNKARCGTTSCNR